MKKILTLVICWLLAFSAMAETTFKAKTAASVAGGYVTSLNKVDGSFEDVVTQWVASVGTIVPTASTIMQGEKIGVWSGTGTGTLDLQWTATSSNTYEASAQVDVQGEDDVYVCAYVGTTETGCKLIPALSKIQKVSVAGIDSVVGSSLNLRLKHTGSDAFNVKVDDGKIEPWTQQAVNLEIKEAIRYTGYTSGTTGGVKFKTLAQDSGSLLIEDDNSGSYTKFRFLKPCYFTAQSIIYVNNATLNSYNMTWYNSSGSAILGQDGQDVWGAKEATIVGYASAGDYIYVTSGSAASDNHNTNFSITASAISENVVQSYAPSEFLGELRFLPQNIAPKGFIPAMGSSIGKSSGTYRGDAYYELYKLLWTQSSVTAGEPYVISSAKGADALTDWNAAKTITIDVSGLFVRAYKSGTSGAVGAKQADAFQGHQHTALSTRLGAAIATGTSYDYGGSQTTSSIVTDGTNGTPRTASETRPTNLAQYAFIRYGNDAPTLYALPTRSEVFSANISASGVATNATQNFVTSCTNAAPSVCSLWSNFGVTPICWAHTTDITKRAEVSASTATTVTVARTDTGTAFNLFCHLK